MPFGRSVFFFLAEKKGFALLCTVARKACGGADKQEQTYRGACSSGRLPPLAPRASRHCRNTARSAKSRWLLKLARSKVQPTSPLFVKARNALRAFRIFLFGGDERICLPAPVTRSASGGADKQEQTYRGACSSGRLPPLAPRASRHCRNTARSAKSRWLLKLARSITKKGCKLACERVSEDCSRGGLA